jgi:nitronate monooxygenase
MWPNRRLIERLTIEHPIVLSPMSGIGTVELAAAVCAAGGLGSIGCAVLQPDVAASEIKALRALTNRPFSVNFFCHPPAETDAEAAAAWRERLGPYSRELGIEFDTSSPRRNLAPFGEVSCRLVEDTRPAVVSFHFGLPAPALLARVKAAGCLVMSSATTVEEAQWLEAHGADIVIAQGAEAGGHRGTFLAPDANQAVATQLGTFALVPQIVDAVGVPVIAAGGIADGRGIAGAFALGAAGVQIGTAYLRCPETATSQPYRDALKHAPSGATVLSNVFTGRPARAVGNRLTREVGPISDVAPAFPGAMPETSQLGAAAQQRGNIDFSPFWAGQASPLGREMPAEALTASLVEETMARFRLLGG